MTTVCILFGGKSSEHEVSLLSAYNVISNLDKTKYNLLLVGITKDGESYLYKGDIEAIKDGTWEKGAKKRCTVSSNPHHHGLIVENKNGDCFIEKVDVYFPVLHGRNGEDGTYQGVFELSGVPYVGNGVTASAVSMDKIMTKRVLKTYGIPVTDGFDVFFTEETDISAIDAQIKETVGYPVVIKPANAGSSVGITMVNEKESLSGALTVAAKEDRRILVEKMIDAREIECAVLGNHAQADASVLGEIVKTTALYDYNTKYIDDSAGLSIPAELDEKTAETIRGLAVSVFKALDCKGLARVDFFVDKKTGEIMLNEINTLPGFTDISMYPMLWKQSGLSYGALLDKLICLATK